MQQRFSPAETRFGIPGRFQKELLSDGLLRKRFVLHELLHFLKIFRGVKRYALAFSSVTAGSAGLLIITLKTLGHVVMYHKPDVGFVNTHSEGYRGHYDIHLFKQEGVLILRACLAVHACMVRECFDIVDF